MDRFARLALLVSGSAALVLTGCSRMPLTSGLDTGGGVTRLGAQTELSSLSSLALDPGQAFVVPQALKTSPVQALQTAGNQQPYYIVETFERDPSVSLSTISGMIGGLKSLGDDLRATRGAQIEAERRAEAAAAAAQEAQAEATKALEQLRKDLLAALPPGPDGNKPLHLIPDTLRVSGEQERKILEATNAARAARTNATMAADAAKQIEDKLKTKQLDIESQLSKGNVIVVDWNQLGAGNISGSAGPIEAGVGGSARASGIAILNGIRKVRYVGGSLAQDESSAGNEPFGNSFSRSRSTGFMLQAREVLYFAIDDEALKARVELDPRAVSTGGWDLGVNAGLARLRQLTNFGALRSPKVERRDGVLDATFNDAWITVQVVGSPRLASPR
jgi:hypothetical protein